jgi:hypothetical protein
MATRLGRRWQAGLAGAVLVTGLVAAWNASAADVASAACGADDQKNVVLARFDLAHARSVWQRLPNLGLAPELLVDSPATVIVFNGPTTHVLSVAPADPGQPAVEMPVTRDHVICVFVNGIPNVYSKVDFTGFVP